MMALKLNLKVAKIHTWTYIVSYRVIASFLFPDELVDIMGYLQDLDKSQLTNLGLVLGLSQRRLRGLMDSATFLSDMIASWLIQADQVGARSGVPTWSSLVTALRHKSVEQNGIANEIATDKHL